MQFRPQTSERAFVESCSLSRRVQSTATHPFRSCQRKQRIMFSPRGEIALNVAMPPRIHFARNNTAKTIVKGRAAATLMLSFGLFAAIFSPSHHYIARDKGLTCTIFLQARPIKRSSFIIVLIEMIRITRKHGSPGLCGILNTRDYYIDYSLKRRKKMLRIL